MIDVKTIKKDFPIFKRQDKLTKNKWYKIFKTSIIFFEFPEVDIQNSRSPLFANASKFLEKIYLKS